MEKKIRLAIVVPCYNEGANIPLLLERFREVFQKEDRALYARLILVDNNSKDDTAVILRTELAKPENGFATSIFEPKPGYGAAIKSGLRAASLQYDPEHLAWTHADIQTDAEDVFIAFTKITSVESQNVLIKGNRVGRPFAQAFFSFGMATIASVLLGQRLYEINAQPKVFHKNLLPHLLDGPDDFSLDLYLLCQAKKLGMKIETIDVHFGTRLHGESKWAYSLSSVIKTVMRTIKYIYTLRKRLK